MATRKKKAGKKKAAKKKKTAKRTGRKTKAHIIRLPQ
jgi:hypothetical protein